MQIIKPSEISGKIMTLIDEAKETIVIISPYYNVTNWDKLVLKINRAKMRNVKFQFYVRMPEKDSEVRNVFEVETLGFEPVEIERLHAKIYFNEKEAIVTSMNLDSRSDTASLDIGMITENREEYNEIISFYENYIKDAGINDNSNINDLIQQIGDSISDLFTRRVQISVEENVLLINCSNTYSVFIVNEKYNMLRLNCILSVREYEYIKSNPELFQSSKMVINLQEATEKHYSLIWGTVNNIKSFSINQINQSEQALIIEYIVGFIKGVEEAKKLTYAK